MNSLAARRQSNRTLYGVVTAALVLGLTALIAYPLATMLIRTFAGTTGGLGPFRRALADPSLPGTLWDTLLIALVCGGIATVIAAVIAWLVERTDARIGWVTSILPLLPLLLPPIAMSVGWLFLADPTVGYMNIILRAMLRLVGITLERGPLNIGTYPGVFFAYVVYLVPFCYLTISSGLNAIDPALEEASRTSGASVWRTLREVSLPALKPALLSALLVSTTFAVAVYSIPGTIGVLAGVRPISVMIVEFMQVYPSKIDQAVVLSLFVLLLLGAMWWLQRHLSGLGHHAVLGGKAARPNIIELGPWRPLARLFLVGYIVIAAILPVLGLVTVSLQPFWSPQIDWHLLSLANFRSLFEPGSPTRAALLNSLYLGFVGASLTLFFAVLLVAYARNNRGVLGQIAEAVGKLPGAIPHVVIGVAFILAFAGPPFRLFGTQLLLLLAYVVMFMPQASVAAATAYDQIGSELLEASRVAGAGQGGTLRRIAVPLMRSGIASGWMLVFVVVTGELNASVLISSNANPVVGFIFLRIWEGGVFPQLAAMAVVLAATTSIVVTLVTVFLTGDPAQKRSRAARPRPNVPAAAIEARAS